jgi:sugar lactone lactonase YvrE
MALALILGQLAGVMPRRHAAAREQPVLVITGTGLERDLFIYQSDFDFNNPDMVERYFSSNKNAPEHHKIWKVKGFDVFSLLNSAGLIDGTDWNVTFKASDGFTLSWSISALESMYWHPDFTAESAERVLPVVGIYRAELFSKLITEFTPPASWDDRALTTADLDTHPPRLFIGQAQGQISDRNQSKFVRSLVRVVVGEERPPADPPPGGTDFANSPYKHITYAGAPYNIDSITGATMTVEGPGVTSYRALSLRQIEETNAGLYRGAYSENMAGQVRQNSYEGLKVSYILDNFVTLRDNIGAIIFKDKSRQTIAEYTLDQVRDESRKMIIAYGINGAPLVYTNLDAGYIPEKYNDNGCFKLVYHAGGGQPAPVFSNVAYIYVEETERPGYEHTGNPPYDDPRFTQYIFTLSGSALGKEVNYTVAQLEAMTGLHLEKEYSLSNSFYFWYYNTYKGVPLWDLLLQAGLNPDTDESTPVRFIAADHYNIPPITVGELKNHNLWGYYEKDPWDLGDGTFDGSGVMPLATGYPVLIAYGYNGYPYVTHPGDPGYNSGLGNDGGPLRIIFGKRDYAHTNGSHQVKYALRVVVGDDVPFTTHTYPPYNQLVGETLTVTVKDEDGSLIRQEALTVSDIGNMIYGAAVPVATADRVRVKGYYYTHNAGGGGTKISDLYEGVGLSYLLFEKIGLPGTMGTVTFTSSVAGQAPLVVNLEDITRADYFNEVTGVDWLKPVLAFAKNGYPMVKTSSDPGYIGSPIVNRFGPLLALFGQTGAGTPGRWLRTVDSITIQISKDPYAHLDPPYDQYAGDTLSISGSGVRKTHTVTVGELELMQNYIFSGEYCLAKSDTEKESASYRGIDIYEFLRREVGFTAGADTVTFKAAGGLEKTFALEEIARRDLFNEITGAGNLKVMLAYGKNEKPLVPTADSAGYDGTAGNDGGPLRLVIGQTAAGDLNSSKSVGRVVEIIVNAAAGDSWKHDYGDYTRYLDLPVLRVTGSQVREPRTFSLRQLEALDQHIVRDLYMGGTEVEGIILWKIIKDVVGLADGVTIPSSIRVFAGANYNQLQNTSQVLNGVVNSQGLTKDIILGYAINGYPLVPHSSSPGYVNNNEYGPLRLIVEENISMWTKWVDCVVVGAGNYEQPRAEDIIADETSTGPPVLPWTVYRNDDGGGLPWASVRCVTPDRQGGLWVGTNGGGAAYRDPAGNWTVYRKNNSFLPHDTVYAIAVDDYDGVWFVGGSPGQGMGAVYKRGGSWTVYTSADSGLPADFAQAVVCDSNGGVWFGTAAGPAYRDQNGVWQVYGKETYGFPAGSVTQIALDNAGGAWFGFYPDSVGDSYRGGYAYLAANGQVTVHTDGVGSFNGAWVRSLSFDNNGGLWVARFGKVDYIAPDGTKTIYTDRELLPIPGASDFVRVVAADHGGGGLWVGTNSGGLLYRNQNGTVQTYNRFNTWPSPQFDSVWYLGACTSGRLYAGSNGGVALLPPFGPASGNTDLAGLSTACGTLFPVFAPANLSYTVLLPAGHGAAVPPIGAAVADTGRATRIITPASGLDGQTTVVVTAQNGAQKTYTVSFTRTVAGGGPVEDPPPAVELPPEPPLSGDWILMVDGAGVSQTRYFTLDDLKAMSAGRVTASYFAINNFGTRSYTDFAGISLAYLLDSAAVLAPLAQSVTVTAQDGYYRQYNLEDVRRDYLDENDPGARLPMILAWREDGRDLTGAYPLKLVVGQTGVGDVNKPNWVRNVMNVTVHTLAVAPGAGTPGKYRPDQDTKTIDVETYLARSLVTGTNQQPIEVVTLSEAAAMAILAAGEGSAVLVSQALAGAKGMQFNIPGSALSAAAEKSLTFIVAGEHGVYHLPAAVIPRSEAANKLGAGEGSLILRITVRNADNTIQKTLGKDQAALSPPVEFLAEFLAGANSLPLWTRGDALLKKELLLSTVVPETATAVMWDPAAKRFTFVPALFTIKNGQYYAVLSTRDNSVYLVINNKAEFADITGHWAEADIRLLGAKLLVFGRSPSLYAPKDSVTRAEMSALLVRALALRAQPAVGSGFSDVAAGAWYAGVVTTAVNAELFGGYPDGTFRPGTGITRQELAVVLARALKKMNCGEVPDAPEINSILGRFSDVSSVGQWARADLALAVKAGLIGGLPDGGIAPAVPVDRAQAAAMLKRFLQRVNFID